MLGMCGAGLSLICWSGLSLTVTGGEGDKHLKGVSTF